MRWLWALLAFLSAPAAAAPLVADLSDHQIAIRSTFTGADILLFGSVNAPEEIKADVVVVVRGPERAVTVRKKSQIGPIWANTSSIRFDRTPGFYWVASTEPLGTIAPPTLLDRQQIGLNHLSLPVHSEETNTDNVPGFRSALIRNRMAEGLYGEEPDAIRFVGPGLFRTTIRLPANVPVGTYRVQAFLLIDGKIEGAHFSPLFIDKSGIEREIYTLATHQPFLYGALAVAIAVLAGWGAGAIFRKG